MSFFPQDNICITDFFGEWIANNRLLGIYIIDELEALEIKRCCDRLGIPFSMENYSHAKDAFGETETVFANNHTWWSFDKFRDDVGIDSITGYSNIADLYDICEITTTEYELLKKLNPKRRLCDIKLLNTPNVKLFSTINHNLKIEEILNNYVLIKDMV